jgi:hypothetical protein
VAGRHLRGHETYLHMVCSVRICTLSHCAPHRTALHCTALHCTLHTAAPDRADGQCSHPTVGREAAGQAEVNQFELLGEVAATVECNRDIVI